MTRPAPRAASRVLAAALGMAALSLLGAIAAAPGRADEGEGGGAVRVLAPTREGLARIDEIYVLEPRP